MDTRDPPHWWENNLNVADLVDYLDDRGELPDKVSDVIRTPWDYDREYANMRSGVDPYASSGEEYADTERAP